MLGSLGLWSSSKGMVAVPNLSGLTNTQAEAAIIAAGLVYSGSSSTTTSNSALNNQVASQLPNANELVEYGSSVSFIYYNYVAVTTTTTTTTSGGGTPPPTTTSAPPAVISNLTYTKTGATTGTLSWSGSNINAYRFTGSPSNYPAPYNYGAYTATWPGNLVNLTEGQSYTVTVDVINAAGAGNSQTITFTQALVTTTTTTTAGTPAPTTTTTTTTVLPSLPTPTFDIYRGWQVYPNSVYATFDITNFDTSYTTTYTSTLGTQNPEFPEQFIVENLTSGQSYTVSITASKSGFTNSTGTATFTALPSENPTTTTTTTVAPTTTTTTTTVAPTTTTTTTTAAPGTFTISGISSTTTSITYSWSNPPVGTAFYSVYYADNDAVYSSETTGSTSKTFSGLTPNTNYTVFVVARSSSNANLGSANASIATQAVATTTTTTSAPTTTTTTTAATTTTTASPTGSPYWYTGCCSTSGSQVTGTSNASFSQAFDNMDAACPTGTITNTQSGNYGTIPTISCAAATTTTSAPATTTTSAPATTTTAAPDCTCNYVDMGTYYYAPEYCPSGSPATGLPGQSTSSGDGCPNVAKATTTAGPTTTTTTTQSSTTYRLCTSFNVANQDCVSQGCDTGGCGQGAICTSGAEYRCAFV